MTPGNYFDEPQPKLFSALLTPHRSLNRTGFLVLMGSVGTVGFAAGLAFLLMGAWPVFGFFGIEKLYLVSKGRSISIARFLGADEKASFAKALTAALQAARRGPTYNPIL